MKILRQPYDALELELQDAERKYRSGEFSQKKLVSAYKYYERKVLELNEVFELLSKNALRRPRCTCDAAFTYFDHDWLSRQVFK
jgi:hypothetical protein